METAAIIELISTIGFPIAACVAMGYFIYLIYKKTTADNAANMEKVQARCAEREEKLYKQIERNQEINGQAIATITLYAERLDTIQKDVSDIKTDIAVMMNK